MLEQLATILGFPFKLVITGLLSGLVIAFAKKNDNLFLKIIYVIISIFASGYHEQVFKLVGYKLVEGTEIVSGFLVSITSNFVIRAVIIQGEKFEKNPIQYIKSIKSKK
jgi:hypothetical protein